MDNSQKPLARFVSRNLVTIVMVPAIIGLHIGWSVLQKNRSLVEEHEEIDMPVITFYKYCLRKLNVEGIPAKTPSAKSENS